MSKTVFRSVWGSLYHNNYTKNLGPRSWYLFRSLTVPKGSMSVYSINLGPKGFHVWFGGQGMMDTLGSFILSWVGLFLTQCLTEA